MKTDIRYEPPVGDSPEDDVVTRVLKDVLERDEAYWGEGECYGVVELGPGIRKGARLTIVFKEGYGYFLEMSFPEGQDRGYHNPKTSDNFHDVVKVWVGQNFLRIPRAFFVNRDQAARIAETFCRSGTQDPVVPWVNSDDTNWKFFDSDDQ